MCSWDLGEREYNIHAARSRLIEAGRPSLVEFIVCVCVCVLVTLDYGVCPVFGNKSISTYPPTLRLFYFIFVIFLFLASQSINVSFNVRLIRAN
jgi:hypothetical protein